MKNEKELLKIVTILMLIVMIALVLVSGTYAKYTTVVSGSDTAVVAKWSIIIGGNEMAVTGNAPTVEFNLFDTIKDTDGTTAESDVKTGLIAPGTSGSFDLKIQNASDVTASYSIAFDVKDDNENVTIPLEFKVGSEENWSTSLNSTTAKTLAVGSGTDTVTVQWRWAFDKDDTSIGIAAQTPINVTVGATITVNQVD